MKGRSNTANLHESSNVLTKTRSIIGHKQITVSTTDDLPDSGVIRHLQNLLFIQPGKNKIVTSPRVHLRFVEFKSFPLSGNVHVLFP